MGCCEFFFSAQLFDFFLADVVVVSPVPICVRKITHTFHSHWQFNETPLHGAPSVFIISYHHPSSLSSLSVYTLGRFLFWSMFSLFTKMTTQHLRWWLCVEMLKSSRFLVEQSRIELRNELSTVLAAATILNHVLMHACIHTCNWFPPIKVRVEIFSRKMI